jgi:hypothetical protein
MNEDAFESIDESIAKNGPAAAFDLLGGRFRRENKLPQLFEARLMKKRFELGLPLIQVQSLTGLPDNTRRAYEDAYIEAAREVGTLYLELGDIPHAWPYFRAIGETTPVAAAIERIEPAPGIEPIIEIAFHERAHPRKGFELILANYGTCSAITSFEQYPGREGREECNRILVRKLHSDLVENLKHAIQQVEGVSIESRQIPQLIANRDWLFEENNYHVDTSHLAAVVRFSIELTDQATLGLAAELTEYGKRLSPLFRYRGNPPFENIYEDYGLYLCAIMGEQVERGVAHFRQKAESCSDGAAAAAQALVNLLVRLNRHSDAIDISAKFLADVDPSYLNCPTAVQLCDLAGDHTRMKQLARRNDDLLSYAAATVHQATRQS